MAAQGVYQLLPVKGDDNDLSSFTKANDSNTPRRSGGRLRFGILLLLTTITLSAFFLNSEPKIDSDAPEPETTLNKLGFGSGNKQRLEQCAAPVPKAAKPPAPVNLWASLTIPETTQIQRWLEAPERQLNLTRASGSQLSDNVIFIIETYHPTKTDALTYLSSGGTLPVPGRFARVTIHHGAVDPPHIADYLVGPLPIAPQTKIRPLTEIYHEPEIPFNARGFLSPAEMYHVWGFITPELSDAMEELFGGTARGTENDTMLASFSGPFSFDGTNRRMWCSWKMNVPGPWLHPVNFFQYVEISGTDPSLWKVLKLVYNHQVFDSTSSFLEAFHNGTLVRMPKRPDQDPSTLDWTTRKRIGEPRDLDHLPGPRSVSFAGLRFRIDRDTQYVSWMGWGMYLGFDRDMGLSLWDIRLKGERIIYQLAPQEAIAQYAGNDPMQTTTAWQDRYFGMGGTVRDMLPLYDCPAEAVYLPATTYSGLGSIVREKAICIFEQDSGRPISRHSGFMDGEFGSVKGYVLTVRSISTVGNYDYGMCLRLNRGRTGSELYFISLSFLSFDYMFQLDGTMEVRVSASGYLQGGFWEPLQEGYGGKIRDTTMGNLHDHMINFKVDFDIAGTENSLLETTTAREQVTQPWFDEDDEWGTEVVQQKITKRIIQTEDEAKVKYPTNFQGGYSIVNQNATNAWGLPRGYAIHAGYQPIHNTVVGSRRLLNNANWARYNLAVSVRKDTEPSSSSMWNMNLPGRPTVDFHKFFDGEDITQKDLVAWINVGTHHLPQAEDSPNTKTSIAMSSFLLTPLNYFDQDISMESLNAILLSAPTKPGQPWSYDDYGVQQDYTCVPRVPEPFEYRGMSSYDVEGEPDTPGSVEDIRKQAEMYHRVKVEL